MSRVLPFLGILCAGLACPAFAAAPPAACGRPITVVYAVADLVTPVDARPLVVDLGPGPKADTPRPRKKARTTERQLVGLVTGIVAPETWARRGGPGKAEYYAAEMSLVVVQPPPVQRQVAELLAALRKLLDVSVSLELRVVSLPEAAAERAGVAFGKGGSAALDEAGLRRLMEFAQGDRRANIMQAPKVTAFDRQRVNYRLAVCDTDAEVRTSAEVSLDRIGVHLSVRLRHDGAEDVTFKGDLSAGGSAVLAGPAVAREVRTEFGPPVLSRIPYVNRLFKNVAVSTEAERAIFVVTPRVIVGQDEKAAE